MRAESLLLVAGLLSTVFAASPASADFVPVPCAPAPLPCIVRGVGVAEEPLARPIVISGHGTSCIFEMDIPALYKVTGFQGTIDGQRVDARAMYLSVSNGEVQCGLDEFSARIVEGVVVALDRDPLPVGGQ